jgi:sulfate permease, SulP family
MQMNLKSYMPILDWFPSYKKEFIKGDLSAGLTVGVMLIPQGMAYAMLAGLPPIYGLYASIVPLIIYAIFGTSRQLAVGPVAMVSLLIAAGVGAIATQGTEQYLALAVLLALMVGVIQLLMGVFRLGFLVNFLSHPVISGFTSAAALIIGFSQLKHLLGFHIPRSNHIHKIIGEAFANISAVNFPTLIVGLVAIAMIIFVKKVKFPLPGPLLAVIFGILAVWGFGLFDQGVKIVGVVPKGLPEFAFPMLDFENIKSLLPIALTISFIGFMESIAVAKAIQKKHKNYKVVPNQELIGLGIANIGGSFFQAFPTTGGFSRTAVNDQTGAKTGLASIISASLIVLTLLFFTPLFYYLPNAILASVIMVAVFGLIDVKEARHLWKTDRSDFWMLAATFTGTLMLGIEEGILIGVVLSLGMIIYRTTTPHIAVLGKIPGKPHYRNVKRFDDLEVSDEVLILRFDARLYFANVNYFIDTFEKEMQEREGVLKLVVLDADSMNYMDSSGVHGLKDLIELCKSQNIQFFIAGLKGPVRDILYRSGLLETIGEDKVFFRIQHAIDAFYRKEGPNYKKYALQTDETEIINP